MTTTSRHSNGELYESFSKGSVLVFIEPKRFLQNRHGVRLTKGVVDVMLNRTFNVIFANCSHKPRRLPKNTVLGTRNVARWQSLHLSVG